MAWWKTTVSPIVACNIGLPALCKAISYPIAVQPLGGGMAQGTSPVHITVLQSFVPRLITLRGFESAFHCQCKGEFYVCAIKVSIMLQDLQLH